MWRNKARVGTLYGYGNSCVRPSASKEEPWFSQPKVGRTPPGEAEWLALRKRCVGLAGPPINAAQSVWIKEG
jgi:hypothetical protein